MSLKLEVFADDDAVAKAAAGVIAAAAREAVAARGVFTLAVSGGKTPWNFRVDQPAGSHQRATTHYWMNALQGVSKKRDYFVSLNSTDLIDPKSVLYSTTYDHPVFTLAAIRAQRELPSLNHAGRTFFCGSYFRYGFHEDACLSGFDAAKSVIRYFRNSQGSR